MVSMNSAPWRRSSAVSVKRPAMRRVSRMPSCGANETRRARAQPGTLAAMKRAAPSAWRRASRPPAARAEGLPAVTPAVVRARHAAAVQGRARQGAFGDAARRKRCLGLGAHAVEGGKIDRAQAEHHGGGLQAFTLVEAEKGRAGTSHQVEIARAVDEQARPHLKQDA